MSNLIKYFLIISIFISSFGFEISDVLAYSVQELELRFSEAEYGRVIEEALDNMRFDPHDKISLEFLQRAKKAEDDLKRAERYLEDDDLRSALIVYMKLKAKSPQSTYLSKIVNQIQADIQKQELKAFEESFNTQYERIDAAIENKSFDLVTKSLNDLVALLDEFKYQTAIDGLRSKFSYLNQKFLKEKQAYEDQLKREAEEKRIKKLLLNLKRRLERAKAYLAKGDLFKAQRTVSGLFLNETNKAFDGVKREAERLKTEIDEAIAKKLEADYQTFHDAVGELLAAHAYSRALRYTDEQSFKFKDTIYDSNVAAIQEKIKAEQKNYLKQQNQLKRNELIANIRKAISSESFELANKLIEQFRKEFNDDVMAGILQQEADRAKKHKKERELKAKMQKEALNKISVLRKDTSSALANNEFQSVLSEIESFDPEGNTILMDNLNQYKAEVIAAFNKFKLAEKEILRKTLLADLETALLEKHMSDASKTLEKLLKDYPQDSEVLELKKRYENLRVEIKKELRRKAKERALQRKKEREAQEREEKRLARIEAEKLRKAEEQKIIEEKRLARLKEREVAMQMREDARLARLKAKEESERLKEEARLERIRIKEKETKLKAEKEAERKRQRELEAKARQEANEKAERKRKLKARLEKQRKERLAMEAKAEKERKAKEEQAEKKRLAALEAELDELIWQVESFEAANDYANALSLLKKVKDKAAGDRRVYLIEKRILRKHEKDLKIKRDKRQKKLQEQRKESQRLAEVEANKEKNKQEELFAALQDSFDVALKNEDVDGAQKVLAKMKATFTDELSQAILMANDSIIKTIKSEQSSKINKSKTELGDVKFDAACDDIRRSIADKDFMIARARLVVLKKQNSTNAEKLDVLSDLEEYWHDEKTKHEIDEERKDQQAKLRKIEILIAEDKYDEASIIAKRLLSKYPEDKEFINVSKLIEKQRQRLKDLCGDRCTQVFEGKNIKAAKVLIEAKTEIVEKPIKKEVLNTTERIVEIQKTDYKDYINNLERKVQKSIEEDRVTAKTVMSDDSKKKLKKQEDEDLKQTLREIKKMINRKEFVKAFDTAMVLKKQYPENEKAEMYHQLARTHMRHMRLEEAKAREEKEKAEIFRQKIYDAQLMIAGEKFDEAIALLEKYKKDYPGNKQIFNLLKTATINKKELRKAKRRELKAKIAKRKKERKDSKSKKDLPKLSKTKTRVEDLDTSYFDEQIKITQRLIQRHNVDTEVFEREIRRLRDQVLQRDLKIADSSISKIRTVYQAVKGLDKQLNELESRINQMMKVKPKKLIKVEKPLTRTERIDRARKIRSDRDQRLDKEIDNFQRTILAFIEAEDYESALAKINELKTDERFSEKAQAVAAETMLLYKKAQQEASLKREQAKLKNLISEVETLKSSGRLQSAKKLMDDNKERFKKHSSFMRLYHSVEREIQKRHLRAKRKREKRLSKLRKERQQRLISEQKEKEQEKKRKEKLKEKKEVKQIKIEKVKPIKAKKIEKLPYKDKEHKATVVELSAIEIEKKEKEAKKKAEKEDREKKKREKKLKELKKERELEEKRLAKNKLEEERKAKLQAERKALEELRLKEILLKQEYKSKLAKLADLIDSAKFSEAKALSSDIELNYKQDRAYERLKRKYERDFAEYQTRLEKQRQKRLESIRKKNADAKILDALEALISQYLEQENFDGAYSALDSYSRQLILDESKAELMRLKGKIDESFAALDNKIKIKNNKLWSDLLVVFDDALGNENYNAARKQLSLMKNKFADYPEYDAKLNRLAGSLDEQFKNKLKLDRANRLEQDTATFKQLLKAKKFDEAKILLNDMKRNYGELDIVKELRFTYKEEFAAHKELKAKLRKQRFDLLVKETKGAIAQGDLLKAKERIKLLKTLYLENRDQLEVISALDKEYVSKELSQKKEKREELFGGVVAELEKYMLERDYKSVLSRLPDLLKDFPEKRQYIKRMRTEARNRLKTQKDEELRKRELHFEESFADLQYLLEQNRFELINPKLAKLFEEFADNDKYTKRLLEFEEKLYSAEIDYFDNDYTKQVEKIEEQLDELLQSKDWKAMKKRLRVLKKKFPLEELIVEYAAKMEEAKLNEQHELKRRLRSKIDKGREENEDGIEDKYKHDCLIFEAKLSELSKSLDQVDDDDAFAAAYEGLQDLYRSIPDVLYEDKLKAIKNELANKEMAFKAQAKKRSEVLFMQEFDEIRILIKHEKFYSANFKFKKLEFTYSKFNEYNLKISRLREDLYKLKEKLKI